MGTSNRAAGQPIHLQMPRKFMVYACTYRDEQHRIGLKALSSLDAAYARECVNHVPAGKRKTFLFQARPSFENYDAGRLMPTTKLISLK